MLVNSPITCGIAFSQPGFVQVNQNGCVGHSSMYSTSELSSFLNLSTGWGLADDKLLRSLCFHIMETACVNPSFVGESTVILENGVRSPTFVDIRDFYWLQNIVLICYSIKIVFNNDKPCFAIEMLPHTTLILPPPQAVSRSKQHSP